MRRLLLALVALAIGSVPALAQSPAREAIGTPTATLTPAIRVGNMVYGSGQLGMRRDATDQSIGAQTRAALENVKRVFEQAGTTMENAVRCTVFLTEVADFQGMNAVYREFWPTSPPARSTVVVKALVVPGAVVEIECMAVMPTP
jgi:2-iminobutanoate/2-iminopropanoate deaminase